ncbi:MAG: hypothetical protein C0602_00305 [Denitrovibrio sp.]|nr:MAG: hypothetical protein C0602_00305 [Denitrovibrio sp.]
MPIITGNNNIIIINSTISDSTLIHKSQKLKNHTPSKSFCREHYTGEIESFIKKNNQTLSWVSTFAKNYLSMEFDSLCDLSIVELANLYEAIQKYK